MVTKVKRAASFTYWTGLNDESKKEAEAGLVSNLNEAIKASSNSEANQMARYYAKHDGVSKREAIGVYFVPEGSTPLFSNVKNGEAAKTFDIMKNGDGLDPETGVSVRSQNNRRMTSQGYDVMLAPPKAISVLLSQAEAMAATGTGNEAKYAREMSDKIQTILRNANNRAMQFIYDQGFFEVRYRDPDTKEDLRAAAADISAVQWQHFSSREGDPQAHFHNVFYNSGRRPDGSTGTIDNIRLLKNIHSVNAVFNADVIRGLAEMGISVTKDGHNYTVDGSVKSLETNFSKRSNKMLEVLKDQYGIDTRGDASAALKQAIVLATRNSKSELPELEQLIIRWGLEAKAEGHNLFTLLEGMKSATDLRFEKEAKEWAEKVEAAAAEGIELPAERPRFDMEEIRESAIKGLTENCATFEERQLNAAILEELSMFCGADEALGLLEELKQSDKIVHIETLGREKIYSTPKIIALEQDLMLRTMEMMQVRPNDRGVPDDIVDGIIAKGSISTATGERFDYRPDQALGIRYFAGAQRVALINGPPGAGKSAMMDGYVRTERACGRRVFGIAPTNRASIVLKNDAHIEAEHTRSVSGMIYDIESGKVQLSPNDVILCDEFGMVGLEDGAKLLKYVDEAGARFRGIGDQDQIQPVPFGASMRSMMHFVDTKFMVHISRQKGWMLDASYAFVAKDFEKGIHIYNEAGCVKLALSYDDMIDGAVVRHLKLLDTNPGESNVIIARTNAEVLETNNRIRDALVSLGALSGESVKFAAMSRGRKPHATEIELRAGDRIIMGDNIKVGSDKIANNAFGTVRSIAQGVDGGEPRLVIEFENGFLWEGVPTELASQFNEESKDEKGNRIPHIALAYAMTVYAAQGLTADHSTLLNSVGMGRQTSLVGMTRARKSHELIADASRIVDNISSRSGMDVQMNKRAATKEDDKDPEAEVTDAEILKELIKEMSEDEAKKNVSDYQADKVAFAKGQTQENTKMVSKEENETKAKAETKVETQAPPAVPRSRVRGLGQFGAKVETKIEAKTGSKTEADQLSQKMQERANSSDRRSVPKPNRPMPGTQRAEAARIQAQAEFKQRLQDESDKMVKHDLRDYMLKNGASYATDMKNPEMGRNATGRFAGGTEYTLSFGKGQGCVVSQSKDGNWGFFMRDGSGKGDIRHFVIWRDGGDFKSACDTLRDELNLHGKELSRSSYSRSEPKVEETRIQRHERLLAKREESAKTEPSKFQQMKEWLQSSSVGLSMYALKRGITEYTQQKLGWFHNEPKGRGPQKTQNPGGIMFPMLDHQGELTGLGRKGLPTPITKGKSFFFAADGSEKHLYRAGEMVDPKVIYTGEAALDVISLYQRDGHPEKAMITATLGNMGDSIEADYYALAKKHPDAKWVWTGQNDEVNDRGIKPADVIQEKATKSILDGNPNAPIDVRHPEVDKDWSAQVQKEMEATRSREQIDAVWSKQISGVSRRLVAQGISGEKTHGTQFDFRDDIRLEGSKGIDGRNAGGVLFALRDRDNFMVGYARYGNEVDPKTSLPFRSVESLDSRGGMIRMGNETNPSVFYSGQHAVEVMQAYEKDGCPKDAALLIAELGVDRKLTREQSLILKQAAKAHPDAQWNFVPEGTIRMEQREAVLVEQAAAHMRMAIREGNPAVEINERVSASMLHTVSVQKIEAEMNAQLDMSPDKSKDIQPEAPKPEVEENADLQQDRRTTENVQRPEPKINPEPQAEVQPDNGAAAAAQVAADEEERRRRAQQQGVSM
jgi:conjugative relaxase-like TrwC/TraI family protein